MVEQDDWRVGSCTPQGISALIIFNRIHSHPQSPTQRTRLNLTNIAQSPFVRPVVLVLRFQKMSVGATSYWPSVPTATVSR